MNELIQLKERTEEKKRIESQIEKARQQEDQLKVKLTGLSAQLKKEFADVERLEGTSLSSLFYSFLGNKIEKIDKERQEYLAAKLKHDSCRNELEHLQNEIDKMEMLLREFGDPVKEFQNKLDEKNDLLKQRGDDKLTKFEDLLEIYYSQKREIKESIDAGEEVLSGLRNAIRTLRKAVNWGTFDMLGGGIIATAVKHSNIDEAKSHIHDVQTCLNRFRRELADVRSSDLPDMNLQFDSFSTFADYFFDNLIFDWVVQSKIHRSLESCEQVYQQVLNIVTNLKVAEVDITKKYKQIREELNGYLINKDI